MQKVLVWLMVVLGIVSSVLLGLSAQQLKLAMQPPEVARQAVYVMGQGAYAPGAEATLRVVVREVVSGQPLSNAKVVVGLRPATEKIPLPLFEGQTDASGVLEAHFTVPDNSDPKSVLVVQAISAAGEDTIEQPVTVQRSFKVLVTTDKPVYQPGQTIHLRTVTFDALSLAPAAMQPIEITIADAKGNKVLRRSLLTSAYGVAAVDFTLADEVNTGIYKITATVGDTTSEASVTVEPYVLPKFRVSLSAERPYYLPGETVRGTLRAEYFFGKPVSGTLELIGYTFDVQLNEVFHIVGQTDTQGQYAFEFTLPDYFVSGNPEQQVATFVLEAQVKDSADHVERAYLNLPVAQQPLVIEAVPESGTLVPGVENIVYLMVATPDGLPVEATLDISGEGQQATLSTNAAGLAEWRFVPSWVSPSSTSPMGGVQAPVEEVGSASDGQRADVRFTVTARDAQGRSATQLVGLNTAQTALLLRPERALYRVGETLKADILAPWSAGAVYLDVVRAGQVLSTRALELKDGRTSVALDLDTTTYGTLELHAYGLSKEGTIYRDTRLVVVEAAKALTVTITPERATYLPGETAHLSFAVSGNEGGVPAVLGLMAVDEAVYALQEQSPGFLKLYFLLEKELLQPRYDLHGWSLPALLEEERAAAQDAAAQAVLAPYSGMGALVRDTSTVARQEVSKTRMTLQKARAAQALPFTYPLVLGLPLAVISLALGDVIRQRRLGQGLIALAVLAALALGVGVLARAGTALGMGLMDAVWEWGLAGLFIMAALSVVAWIALLVRALHERAMLRGAGLVALLLYMGALVALGYALRWIA